MNLNVLYDILKDTTYQYRKGAEIDGTPELVEAVKSMKPGDPMPDVGGVVEFYDMPPFQAAPKSQEMVDMVFIVVGVDTERAQARKDELKAALKDFPLKDGPSYITVGGLIGDQGAALCLFALGYVLGLWNIGRPRDCGFTGDEERKVAGSGYLFAVPNGSFG